MNNTRRKAISAAADRITDLLAEADSIREDVEALRDEEQEYRDNMPESLAMGEKGEKADAAIAALDEVVDALQSIVDADMSGNLDTAQE